MFPIIELWFLGSVHTFWLTLMLCFFIFVLIAKKISTRLWVNFSYFSNRLLIFFLSTVIFSRIFYVVSYWNDYKYLESPISFFFMSDYNFSLMWAIFWFFLVLFFTTITHKIKNWRYVDISVLAFLFSSFVWYIWAFLWWQVYWRETQYGIEVIYNNPFSPVPYETWVFPLALFYAAWVFILFSILYISAMFVKIRWIVGYLGLWLFASLVLILEQFSWKYDYFYQNFWYSLNMVFSIILIIFSFNWLLKIWFSTNKEKELTL